MEEKKDSPIKPLFTNPPEDRTQPESNEIIPETLPEEPIKTVKDIPQQTRSSRIIRALLKLDVKDRKIVKGLTEGKEEKEVLKSVGYSDSYINSERKKIINKPAIQDTLAIIMENTGITDEFMLGKLKKGMDATKLHGTGKDSQKVEDFSTQHKFIETGLKLKGHLDKKVDIVHHKSHEDQLRELQGGEIIDADYDEILPDA